MNSVNPAIFKAYDIRGTYPDQLNDKTACLLGKAFVQYLGCNQVAVGRDMRLSSPKLFQNLSRGITAAGADVIDIGLCSTDALYFTVGKFGYGAGIMITASHNPKQYNGFKMCREEAIPLSGQSGLEEIKQIILQGKFMAPPRKGNIVRRDIIGDYLGHVLSFINPVGIKPFKIVIDAGNGMAGLLAPKLFSHLSCQVIPMF